jgi:hypothetical protein
MTSAVPSFARSVRASLRLEFSRRIIMANTEKLSATQQQEDLAEVYRFYAEGKRITDPELVRRIRERSEAARKAVCERNRLLDVAVPSIRSLRDGDER